MSATPFTRFVTCTRVNDELLIQPVQGEFVAHKIRSHLASHLDQRLELSTCPCCEQPLEEMARGLFTHQGVEWRLEARSGFKVDGCRRCGFWRRVRESSVDGPYWDVPFLRSFYPQRHLVALSRLDRAGLLDDSRRNLPQKISGMTGVLEPIYGKAFRVHRFAGGEAIVTFGRRDPLVLWLSDASARVEAIVHLFNSSLINRRSDLLDLNLTTQTLAGPLDAWVHLPDLEDRTIQVTGTQLGALLETTGGQLIPVPPRGPRAHVDHHCIPVKGGHLVKNKTRLFFFDDGERRGCWEVLDATANEARSLLSGGFDSVKRALLLVRLVEDDAFGELLATFSDDTLDLILGAWRIASGSEDLVEWGL